MKFIFARVGSRNLRVSGATSLINSPAENERILNATARERFACDDFPRIGIPGNDRFQTLENFVIAGPARRLGLIIAKNAVAGFGVLIANGTGLMHLRGTAGCLFSDGFATARISARRKPWECFVASCGDSPKMSNKCSERSGQPLMTQNLSSALGLRCTILMLTLAVPAGTTWQKVASADAAAHTPFVPVK